MNFIFYFYGIHEYFVFRTCNPGFRKPMLYPIEPRNRNHVNSELSIRFACQFLNSLETNSPLTYSLFCNLRRIRTFNLRFRKPTLYPIEPWDFICEQWIVNFKFTCETKFTIHHSLFVIPEGLEPSTFGVSDRCSNQLNYEIVFNLWISNRQSALVINFKNSLTK